MGLRRFFTISLPFGRAFVTKLCYTENSKQPQSCLIKRRERPCTMCWSCWRTPLHAGPAPPVTVTKAMLIPGLKPGPPLRRLAQRWIFCPAVCSAGRSPFWLTAALRQYMQCWAHWQPAGFTLCLTLPRGKAACGISFPRWRPLRFWPMQPIWCRRKFWPVRRQCWACGRTAAGPAGRPAGGSPGYGPCLSALHFGFNRPAQGGGRYPSQPAGLQRVGG